ncbi:Hypothetical predicted protein [Marmota monax]|uniref:Uncharacterized protein n=1 Tax=Marmota monax TaxID=9995 RepID=A0A5E4D7J6_MARMO|nr:Hypothetical predicted protein [Marmota monax]
MTEEKAASGGRWWSRNSVRGLLPLVGLGQGFPKSQRPHTYRSTPGGNERNAEDVQMYRCGLRSSVMFTQRDSAHGEGEELSTGKLKTRCADEKQPTRKQVPWESTCTKFRKRRLWSALRRTWLCQALWCITGVQPSGPAQYPCFTYAHLTVRHSLRRGPAQFPCYAPAAVGHLRWPALWKGDLHPVVCKVCLPKPESRLGLRPPVPALVLLVLPVPEPIAEGWPCDWSLSEVSAVVEVDLPPTLAISLEKERAAPGEQDSSSLQVSRPLQSEPEGSQPLEAEPGNTSGLQNQME